MCKKKMYIFFSGRKMPRQRSRRNAQEVAAILIQDNFLHEDDPSESETEDNVLQEEGGASDSFDAESDSNEAEEDSEPVRKRGRKPSYVKGMTKQAIVK